ncbi:hypothetical protein B0I37DRAFT_448086 [Chaetomium sp. MPI-CAGE-AT-0009]|nr:hypothetical protein B0I37DRAFT_448086 [Chaetomium sp. MPI-CAGE-AT-0009]
MAFIRPFKPEDTESAKHIVMPRNPPPHLTNIPAAIRMAPYLWTLPFTHLFPQHCFVLDDGSGTAVGYVVGTPDVFALAAEYPRYVAEVLGRGGDGSDGEVNPGCLAQLAYRVDWLVLEGVEGKRELAEGWRGMLHIDLLEGWQGQGWGRKMIERFVEGVKGSGETFGKGVHLGVAGDNRQVVAFYEKVGFRVYPGGEKEGGNVWMVRDL